MKQQREETMAAALWAYIERLRQQDGSRLDGLTPEDVEELAKSLRTAGDLNAALQADASPAYGNAAERVRAAIAARPRQEPAAGSTAPRHRLPAFGRTAAAGMLAASLAVAFVAGQHSLPTGSAVSHTHPGHIGCRECRERFRSLAADRLTDQQARDLLWHLAKCPSCYAAYHVYEQEHPEQRG